MHALTQSTALVNKLKLVNMRSTAAVALLVICLQLTCSNHVDAFSPNIQHSTGVSQCRQQAFTNCLRKKTCLASSPVATLSKVEKDAPLLEFTSPEMKVFIEETDAYGVVYNANYLRIYDRALHMISISQRDIIDGPSPSAEESPSVLDHEGWSIVEVTQQKFKSSPPLGGVFVVNGKLKSRSDNKRSEVWDLQIQSPSNSGNDEAEQAAVVVYNTATLTIARPDLSSTCIPKPDPFPTEPDVLENEYSFMLYRDEFDTHLPTHLPLRNVLNLFERARSNGLGGPDALRRMQQEDEILWVVTSIDSCSLVNLGYNDGDQKSGLVKVESRPGQTVTVKTDVVVKRRGMILEFRQTLFLPPSKQSGDKTLGRRRRLAQAVVTIMALNARTRRPTSKLPEWVMELVQTPPSS